MKKEKVNVEREKVTNRIFDKDKYSRDLESLKKDIKAKESKIDKKINKLNTKYNNSFANKISSSYNSNAEYEYALENDKFDTQNKFQLEVMDLKNKWKKAEYEFYFSKNEGVSFNIDKLFREL